MLSRFFRLRRERRERIAREARDLLLFMGEAAYGEARSRGRACRAKGDHAGFRHWSRVAVEIADRTGIRIGEKVVDRYAVSAALSDDRLSRQHDRRATIDGLVDIAAGIADLTHGRSEATALTICARVWQLAEINPSVDVRESARALRAAIEALASEPAHNAASLAAGIYPPRAELAGQALQRFKSALL